MVLGTPQVDDPHERAGIARRDIEPHRQELLRRSGSCTPRTPQWRVLAIRRRAAGVGSRVSSMEFLVSWDTGVGDGCAQVRVRRCVRRQ